MPAQNILRIWTNLKSAVCHLLGLFVLAVAVAMLLPAVAEAQTPMTSARVEVIFWGHEYKSTTTTSVRTVMGKMFKDLVTGPFIKGLAQYGIAKGSVAGTVFIDTNASNPAPTLQNMTQLQNQLISWIQSGKVPAPAINEDNLLYVIVPPVQTELYLCFCNTPTPGYQGIHWSTKYNAASTQNDVILTVVKTIHDDPTNAQLFINNVSGYYGHEMVEAFNDPLGGREELGDPCEYYPGYHYLAKWWVQRYWSDRDHSCIPQGVLWQDANSGNLSIWMLDGAGNVANIQTLSWQCGVSNGCSNDWKVVGTGDFDNDGTADVLWHNQTTGVIGSWLLDSSGTVKGTQNISNLCSASNGCPWQIAGTGDFAGDGEVSLLLYDQASGNVGSWLLDGLGDVVGGQLFNQQCGTANGCPSTWHIVGGGDFNNDGNADVLWHDTASGTLLAWLLDGNGTVIGSQYLSKSCGSSGCSNNWHTVGVGDLNADGNNDVLWYNPATGQLQEWLLDGKGTVTATKNLSSTCPAATCFYGKPVGVL